MARSQVKQLPSKKVSPPKRLVVMNPSKGLNNLGSSTLIDDKEWADLMNIEYDEGGVLRKRSGYVTAGDALTAAHGLGIYTDINLNQKLVTIDNGSLKYRTTGNWSTAAGGVSFTVGNDVSFTQARLKLFAWDGANAGAYFDGTTVTRNGHAPKAKFSVYYQNRHIAAGADGQPSRLFISKLSDATEFTVTTGGTQPQPDNTTDSETGTANVPGATAFSSDAAGTLTNAQVIDIRKDDGDLITGLALFQDLLIVFKKYSIYQVTFASDGTPTVTPITYATGALNFKSVIPVENDVYFMSADGIRILGNQPGYISSTGSTIRTRVLSIRIQPTISTINPSYYSRMNGVYFNYKYILGVPTSTSSIDRQIVYDTRFDAFSIWKNFNAQAMVVYPNSSGTPALYFLDDGGTRVYMRQDGTYNDNGSAIEAWATSKAQSIGNPDLTKFWVDLRLIFRRLNGQLTLTVYEDGNLSVGTATIGSGGNRGMGLAKFGSNAKFGTDGQVAVSTTSFVDVPEGVGLNLDSRTLAYKVYNNRVNENFVLLGHVLAYYPKSHYVFDSSNKIYL